MATRSTVPVFPPDLRHVGLFAHSHTLHDTLLAKAVNAERASYHAPKFLKLTVGGVRFTVVLCGAHSKHLPSEPLKSTAAAGVHGYPHGVRHGLQAGQSHPQDQSEEQLAAHRSQQVGVVLRSTPVPLHYLILPPSLPLARRPPTPMMDSVREKFSNNEKLAEDFSIGFRGCELADVVFIVGKCQRQ